MPTIPSSTTLSYMNTGVSSVKPGAIVKTAEGTATAVQGVSSVRPEVNISSLASRLNQAESFSSNTSSGLSRDQLAQKVRGNIEKINYPLTPENKTRMAQEVPQPADAASSASAAAASNYVNNLNGPNPFAGLSREQLSTIANDESGTFTTNEKYAAYRQGYDEEQQWRTKVVAEAMAEYHSTGKLTDFFQSVLDHFKELPDTEKSLYPEDYATDLQEKIDLDFNYFTNMPNGLPGKANVSLANLNSGIGANVQDLVELPDSYPGFPAAK
jgi:uncharacterized phage infection (PIP) family protein YhgE